MRTPDRLGIDADNGVVHLLTVLSLLDVVYAEPVVEVFITTEDGADSHFHVETDRKTSVIVRRFLGDDDGRIRWALARRCWNGRPPDYLAETKGNRQRKKISISFT